MSHSPFPRYVLDLPGKPLSLDRVRVMGILNMTPDSFYDRGRYFSPDLARERAHAMVQEGAAIIDVGGEKAGPGEPVSDDEEIERVVPIIEVLSRELDVPISVDTFKPRVAEAAVRAGASIINSIGGMGPDMQRVAAQSGAAVVIMHIQGQPRVAHPHPVYQDPAEEVRSFLLRRAQESIAAGIPPNRVIIDPGLDFGKNTAHGLAILHDLRRLTELPYPVLLAVSRKRFIGEVLGTDVEDRLEGSLAVTAWGVQHGVRLVRTHDVAATQRVCRMVEAVYQPELVERGES